MCGEEENNIKRPLFWIAVCFALGEAYAVAAGHSVIVSGLMIMAALVLSVCTDRAGTAMSFFRNPIYRRLLTGNIFLLVTLLGFMNIRSVDRQGQLADEITEIDRCRVVCSVYDVRNANKDYHVYVKTESMDNQRIGTKLILYMDNVDDIKMGQQIAVYGRIERPDIASNPGEFDARSYYAYKGIYMICRDAVITERGRGYSTIRQFLYSFRLKAGETLDRYLAVRDASVMRAMLLGEKSGIDRDTKRLFQLNGIAHILAISGVHIAIIGMTLFKLLRRISGSNVMPGIVSVCVIVLYGMMTGLASSTCRAVIMMTVVVAAKIKGRSPDMMTSAGIACVIQAVADPYIVMDAGFQLSFAAVLGIAVVDPMLEKIVGHGGRLSALRINVSVTLTTTPLVVYYFYQFPLYSVVLNMVVVPFVSVLIFCSMAAIFFGMMPGVWGFASVTAQFLAMPVRYILAAYRALCELMCKLPEYSVNVGHVSVEMVAVYYVTLVVVLWLLCRIRQKNIERPTVRRAAVLAVFFAVACVTYEYMAYDRNFRVVYMDVGQGDGILIRSGKGVNILIDGGSSDNSQVGEYVIVPVLRYYGAAHIDYAFVTHADSDHISGLKYILQTENTGIIIENIVLPLYGMQDDFEELKEAAGNAGVNILYMKKGDAMEVSAGGVDELFGRDMAKISLSFLYPGPETGINDINELSAVIRLDYQSHRMLFTGDLGDAGERYLLDEHADVRADVLKVGHHGSRYSSCVDFLDAVSPEFAVISAGADNRYGHPHAETLDRLEAHRVGVKSTIECGAVSVKIDRGGLKLEQYR